MQNDRKIILFNWSVRAGNWELSSVSLWAPSEHFGASKRKAGEGQGMIGHAASDEVHSNHSIRIHFRANITLNGNRLPK